MFFWDTNCVIDFETAFSQQWVVFSEAKFTKTCNGGPLFFNGKMYGSCWKFLRQNRGVGPGI